MCVASLIAVRSVNAGADKSVSDIVSRRKSAFNIGAVVRINIDRIVGVFPFCGVDELSDDDKLVVARASRAQRFLSQPFHVAEQFTGVPGVMVPLSETIRGFKMILNGEVDEYPEQAFLNVGTIDQAIEKGKKLLAEIEQ